MSGCRWRTVGVAVLVAACGTSGAPNDADETEFEDANAVTVPADSAGQPLLPVVQPGGLHVRANHEMPKYRVDRELDAVAWRCDEEGASIQILGMGEAIGLAIVVAPVNDEPANRSYDVKPELRGIPEPATARVGLQLYPEAQVSVMQGMDGTVVLDTAGTVLTGRVTATIRETSFLDSIPLVVAFSELPVTDTSGSACEFFPQRGSN